MLVGAYVSDDDDDVEQHGGQAPANRTSSSSPEAALLLVSTKNRDLWPGLTPEVRDSRTSRHSAHAQSQVWQI